MSKRSEGEARRREEAILGAGPRIPPLRPEELDPASVELVLDMIGAVIDGEEAATFENVPEIIPTMLRHPQLFRRSSDLSIELLGSGRLDPRERELVILRIAWLCGAPYEWSEHVEIAKRLGVSSDEIDRITVGSRAKGWSRHESALLCAVEELREDAMISDATWATLAARLDEAQLIELPLLVGQYQATAYFQNALRLRLRPGSRGLEAR